MIQKLKAISLRNYKFRETSLIVTFFTEQFGKMKAIVKGVRKEKSPLLSLFEPFTYQEIVCYYKPKREINLVTDSIAKDSFPRIRNNFVHICIASYFVDLVDEFTQLNMVSRDLFHLLLSVLRAIEKRCTHKVIHYFEVQLLDISGLFPQFNSCVMCRKMLPEKGARYFSFEHSGCVCDSHIGMVQSDNELRLSLECCTMISLLLRSAVADLESMHLTKAVHEEISYVIKTFIAYQLRYQPRSMHVLRDLAVSLSTN